MVAQVFDLEGARKPSPFEITDEEGRAMLKACVNLFLWWRISKEEASVITGVPAEVLSSSGVHDVIELSTEQKTRLSHIMAIHRALRTIFDQEFRVYGWITAPNTTFQGRSALDVILSGELSDLARVRRYLTAVSGTL